MNGREIGNRVRKMKKKKKKKNERKGTSWPKLRFGDNTTRG